MAEKQLRGSDGRLREIREEREFPTKLTGTFSSCRLAVLRCCCVDRVKSWTSDGWLAVSYRQWYGVPRRAGEEGSPGQRRRSMGTAGSGTARACKSPFLTAFGPTV